ncbi:MAG: cupin domain-containing protein [Oscillospiraceae bacterium]|nr:cupin domain-containing protein [Oscillospiraceae bacterium]MDD4368057.1 cupin domain-containing protein [Oscillospiraceae bacterium]
MSVPKLKNIQPGQVLALADLVEYRDGEVVSRTLSQNEAVSLTLFAFAAGEEISTHTADGDALVTVLDGCGRITLAGQVYAVEAGQSLVMPAGVPHAVAAEKPFKMQLTVVY